MIGMAVFLVAATFGVGLLYWRLDALPGAHRPQVSKGAVSDRVRAGLARHVYPHIFWVASLLLALIDLPDFGTLFRRISAALDGIASANGRRQATFGWHGPTRSARRHLTPRLPTPESRSAEPQPAHQRRVNGGSSKKTIAPGAELGEVPSALRTAVRQPPSTGFVALTSRSHRHRERSLFGSLAGRRETRHGLVPKVLFDRRGKSRSLPPYRTDTRVGHGRGPCCPCCGG